MNYGKICAPLSVSRPGARRTRSNTAARILKSLGLEPTPEDGRHASRYHAAASMFRVERADDCIWLADERGPAQNIHMTPGQASDVGEALLESAAGGVPVIRAGRAGQVETAGIQLDADLRAFLEEVMSCQSLGLAAWATRIVRRGTMTMSDLERCLVLGFEF